MENLDFFYIVKRSEFFNSEVFKSTLRLIEKDFLTPTFYEKVSFKEEIYDLEIYALHIQTFNPVFEKEVKIENGCVEEAFKKLLSENIEFFSQTSSFFNKEVNESEILIRIQLFGKSDLNFYNKLTDKEKINDFIHSFKSDYNEILDLALTNENSDLSESNSSKEKKKYYLRKIGKNAFTKSTVTKITHLSTIDMLQKFNYRKFINTIGNIIEDLNNEVDDTVNVSDKLHILSNVNVQVVCFSMDSVSYRTESVFEKNIDISEGIDIEKVLENIFIRKLFTIFACWHYHNIKNADPENVTLYSTIELGIKLQFFSKEAFKSFKKLDSEEKLNDSTKLIYQLLEVDIFSL
jgi:hypothetical protein